jgi:hypothetical protein
MPAPKGDVRDASLDSGTMLVSVGRRMRQAAFVAGDDERPA